MLASQSLSCMSLGHLSRSANAQCYICRTFGMAILSVLIITISQTFHLTITGAKKVTYKFDRWLDQNLSWISRSANTLMQYMPILNANLHVWKTSVRDVIPQVSVFDPEVWVLSSWRANIPVKNHHYHTAEGLWRRFSNPHLSKDILLSNHLSPLNH